VSKTNAGRATGDDRLDDDHRLGMDRPITRKDFLNQTLLGVGASLLSFWPDSAQDGFYMLLASPEIKQEQAEPQSKTVIFVLDRSGSMAGKKIEQSRQALQFVVNNLNDGDLFNVITYDDRVEAFRPELAAFDKKSRNEATSFISNVREGGSTNIDPDRDNPFLFLKSPRSTIIDPGQPFVIPRGVETIDWEGEFTVVMGREARDLTLDNAMDYVFGFTILYDLSDRAAQIPGDQGRYPNDWFPGKSLDHAAPMGPYIVPKEFLPNYGNVRVTTRVNGEVMQDSDTSYLIHDVERLLRYATGIMTLWPGDMLATGTPEGVGHGRTPRVYLKPGDVVEIEIEGIGTLVTPIR